MQGMKQMAAEMQRELDTTRQELRRGILELPQETAESAAQMRRVIVDQIEALAELNRIVARHGRGIDTAASRAARAASSARSRCVASVERPAARRRAHRRRGRRRRRRRAPHAAAAAAPRRARRRSARRSRSRSGPQRLARPTC